MIQEKLKNEVAKLPIPPCEISLVTPLNIRLDQLSKELSSKGGDANLNVYTQNSSSDRLATTVQPTTWGIDSHTLHSLTNFEAISQARMTSSALPENRKFGAYVMLTNLNDSKKALTTATQLLRKCYLDSAIEADDVDQSLLHNLLQYDLEHQILWPLPELILNFQDVTLFAGYPPWQLRYAEIINVGHLVSDSMPYLTKSITNAFEIYSNTVQRFGK